MPRDAAELPKGKDGLTSFPLYEYDTKDQGTGGNFSGSTTADPVQYSCQKNFIMLISDGDSTKDDFDVENDIAGGRRLRRLQTR